MRRALSLLVLLTAFGLVACGAQPPPWDPTPPPEDTPPAEMPKPKPQQTPPKEETPEPLALRVCNWNLEWFGSTTAGLGPTDKQLQLQNAISVMQAVKCDLWGLVEVVSGDEFQQVVAALPGYEGFLSNDDSVNNHCGQYGNSYCYSFGEQKVAAVYRKDLFTKTAAQLLIPEDAGDFAGRPPLRVDLEVTHGKQKVPLVFVVLHMKAKKDGVTERPRASVELKTYLDGYADSDPGTLIVGDWNDDFSHSVFYGYDSPYANFFADPRYTLGTGSLSDAKTSTTVFSKGTIDHQLMTGAWSTAFVPGSAQVRSAEASAIADYGSTTSDHYPVSVEYQLQ